MGNEKNHHDHPNQGNKNIPVGDKNRKPWVKDYKDVIEAEKRHLQLDTAKNVYGLALSGGGIRSAAFGLGVLQALVAKDQLKRFHYMSTVSGGGYIGAALTFALNRYKFVADVDDDQHPEYEEDALDVSANFPLGKKSQADRQKGGPPDNDLLNFIRHHGNFLIPTDALGIVSFASVVFRGMMLSLMVYFGLAVVVTTLWRRFHFALHLGKYDPCSFFHIQHSRIFFQLAALLLGLYVLLSILYSLVTFFDLGNPWLKWLGNYKGSNFTQRVTGYLWQSFFVLLLVGFIPIIATAKFQGFVAIGAGGTSSLFGIIVGIWQYIKAMRKEANAAPTPGYVIFLAAFGLVYGALILAYQASSFFLQGSQDTLSIAHLGWFVSMVVFVTGVGLLTDINMVGPHRVYRNRLMEAFLPNKTAAEKNTWEPALKADEAFMSRMWKGPKPMGSNEESEIRCPYHIINTNLILCNSDQVKYRSRAGDNFIISPLYCGSDATGWEATEKFKAFTGGEITLATAMAASGAAVNPNAGVSGEGVTRNKILSLLLSLLNLRLGVWTINPKKKVSWPHPNFFYPGLYGEILRFGYEENSRRLLLSDGGHFENLAIYELIRRKVKVIFLSDGAADGTFNFDDLANAVEKVRVDFGTNIYFRTDPDLKADLGPNGFLFSTTNANEFQKKYHIASRGYAVADIIYNDQSKGLLFYVKLAMVDGLATDVYSFKGMNPDFPHESTLDQFFSEKQFEAYRELGYFTTQTLTKHSVWNEFENPA